MHWADKLAYEIIKSGKFKPYWVDDMKTPSGYAHIGSMLGPIIHSCIYRALKDNGCDAKLTYVFNDFDVADEFPAIFKEFLSGHEGKVLKMIPSPGPGFDNFGDFIADDLKKSIEYLGFEAEYISSWDLYKAGKFDDAIKTALDGSEKIQDIYEKVSGSKKRESGWLPFQVICENCGKLGTTKVYDWDGKKVSYRCEPNLVTWAVGCGHEGKISPFGGTGKLPWKVDWAAHWKVLDITIEGAGKDHASAGGSYDIALTILEQVFKKPKPYHFGYEFLLIGGRKMSSSKGVGLKAHDLVKILPAPIARYLFVSADIFSQNNFDPVGTMAIPDLFDSYDKAWEAYDKGGDEKLARTYVLSQIKSVPEKEKGFFAPRFRDVANYIAQGLNDSEVLDKFKTAKSGKLDDSELDTLEERMKYAKVWLQNYSPDEYRFELTGQVPAEAEKLSVKQKEYLKGIMKIYNEGDDAQSLQVSLFELAKEVGISTSEAFRAIYISFIGKEHGPRAGMLLSGFGREAVFERIIAVVSGVTKSGNVDANIQSINMPNYFTIDKQVKMKFPSISVGIALINGITVKPTDENLQKEIDAFVAEQKGLTTEILGTHPEIVSYRKLYKEMGVDWHSKRPGPEELLRRVALKKELYRINNCVDSYNLIVMKNCISVGAFDADKIKFPASLRFANEGDEILLIGNSEPVKYTSRELVYYDMYGGYNMDFNYRDAQRTMVTSQTKNVWINVDGIYEATPEKVQRTLDQAVKMIIKYCGGNLVFSGVTI